MRASFVIGMAACLIANTVNGASGGQFEGEVVASWINGGTDRDMKLTQPFTFIDSAGKRWTAPADAVINGASIPQPLWTWHDPFIGAYRRASVVHDYYEHGHPGEHSESIVADVPAAGVTRVELVGAGGTVLTSRAASARAPRVQVIAPRRAQRVGGSGDVLVRWRAADPDGDRLDVKVDYSADDGRSWRLIHIGSGGSSVRLPNGLLGASRRARIRVRANDGFHESAAQSGRFRSLGHKPHVRITSPGGGTAVRADEAIYLAGNAYDDQHLSLTGKRLQWYDGRRRIGSGSAISAEGLRPGRHVIRLVARDRLGRRASASVRLRVRAVKPAVLSLVAPEAVRPTARRLRLSIAGTVAARLDVRGPGVRSVPARVSRRPRSVSVRVRPGGDALRLTLTLRAGRRLTRVPLAIARG